MKKILVVDDVPLMLEIIESVLSPDYQVVCAGSGEEGLQRYSAEMPDLVLTDMVMPGMSGLEMLQRLHKKYDEVIPAVLMTSDEREESEALGLRSGAIDYIRKPFRPELLRVRVENAMRYVTRLQELKTVAETDLMTGFLNKTSAQRTLGDQCAKASGVLMMIDLDSFKLVNDIYGHDMGDKVLIRFAEIIRSVIRTSDVAGRIGGDEFAVFCREVKSEQLIEEKARSMNEQILSSARALMGEEMNIPLGVSVGAVYVPEEGTAFEELYRKADKALYQTKKNGGHGYSIFHSNERPLEETRAAASSLADLRKILEERNRQRGAYELNMNQFKVIYRHTLRSIENYRRSAELVQFTLQPDPKGADPVETVADRFGSTLRSCLRRSDVYARSGRRRFVVLLPEVDGTNESLVMHRVMEEWSRRGEHTQIRYETMVIHGEHE